MQSPSIGRIVYDVAPGSADGTYPPAIASGDPTGTMTRSSSRCDTSMTNPRHVVHTLDLTHNELTILDDLLEIHEADIERKLQGVVTDRDKAYLHHALATVQGVRSDISSILFPEEGASHGDTEAD